MGTSGAYGGSGSASWDSAHDVYQQAADPSSGSMAPSTEQLVSALAAALRRISSNTDAPSVADTIPGRGSGADGYTRSRTAGGSGRSFLRQAARGARTVAGAQAYRARDGRALAELGLDLAALEALHTDRDRCVAIADALLGAPARPDDAALKAASIKTMIEILRGKDAPTTEQVVESYTANLTYEQVLVELTSQRRTSTVPAAQAAKIETQIKKYIRSSLRAGRRTTGGRLNLQALVERATSLAARVLTIFGRTQ